MAALPLAAVVAVVALVRAAGWWAPLDGKPGENAAALAVMAAAWAATLAAVVARRPGLAARAGLAAPAGRRWWLVGIGVGLAIVAVRLPVVWLVLQWHGQVVGNLDTPAGGFVGWELAVVVGSAVVLAPVVEEVVFRGALTGVLTRRWSPLVAAVASTVLFAVAHLIAAAVVQSLVFGAAASWLTARYRSVWPAVVAHVTLNGVTIATVTWAARAGVGG